MELIFNFAAFETRNCLIQPNSDDKKDDLKMQVQRSPHHSHHYRKMNLEKPLKKTIYLTPFILSLLFIKAKNKV